MKQKNKLLENTIVKHYAGSISYGTNTASSDTDFRGIFAAEKVNILSPFSPVKEVNDSTEEDTVLYELGNFLKLYMNANPNIVETLWVKPEHVVQTSPAYDLLVKHRSDLLSRQVAQTFTGFAVAQAKRLKNHSTWIGKELNGIAELQRMIDAMPCIQLRDWIMENFPEVATNGLDFSKCQYYVKHRINFDAYLHSQPIQMLTNIPLKQKYFIKMVHNHTEDKVFARDFDIEKFNEGFMLYPYGSDIYALHKMPGETCLNEDGSIHKIDRSKYNVDEMKTVPLFVLKFCKNEYETAYDNRRNYHTWRKNRNPARAELEFEHGYDTKYAMHTVRILRMAEEVLRTGELQVYRPDAEELLAIRNGSWSYEEVMKYQEEKVHLIDNVLTKASCLPVVPDVNLAEKLCMDIREMIWYK